MSIVLSLIQILYAIGAIARDENLSYQQRHTLRLEKSLPVINETGAYINMHKASVMPESPLGKAFEYCKNRWTSLQNYLTNGMGEIDSNLLENIHITPTVNFKELLPQFIDKSLLQ